MPRIIVNYIFLCLFVILSACSKRTVSADEQPLDTLAVTEARGFAVYHYQDRTELVTFKPGTREVRERYEVRKPYTRLVTTSATHIGMLDALGALDRVVGATNTNLIYSLKFNVESLKKPSSSKVESCIDVGDAMKLDAERILAVKPEVVLLTDYGQSGTNQEESLTRTGVQLINVSEWREESPLGRAEWIKFFGVLVGKEKEAVAYYERVRKNYLLLTSQSSHSSQPTILSGADFRGTWYLPTGGTYMGQLFRDAGFAYKLDGDTAQESRPYNFESVLRDFADADVWVGAPANSLAELKQMDDKHTLFKAYKTGRVYNFLKRTTPEGGNDFWESGVVRPDRILQDLILIQQDGDPQKLFYSKRLTVQRSKRLTAQRSKI